MYSSLVIELQSSSRYLIEITRIPRIGQERSRIAEERQKTDSFMTGEQVLVGKKK